MRYPSRRTLGVASPMKYHSGGLDWPVRVPIELSPFMFKPYAESQYSGAEGGLGTLNIVGGSLGSSSAAVGELCVEAVLDGALAKDGGSAKLTRLVASARASLLAGVCGLVALLNTPPWPSCFSAAAPPRLPVIRPRTTATAPATTPGEFIWLDSDITPATTRVGMTTNTMLPPTNQPRDVVPLPARLPARRRSSERPAAAARAASD
mmetsp:Transcript_23447/g.66919  ORF Transcript_23447/g.66919 Transcript_23447/m.66919 type:complete len:207 (-) Transcript_23447:210-830(-)